MAELKDLSVKERNAVKKYLEAKQSVEEAERLAEEEIKKIKAEFAENFKTQFSIIDKLGDEIFDIVNKTEKSILKVDNLIELNAKMSTRTNPKYKDLFETALNDVSEKVKKKLLKLKDTTAKISETKKLIIKEKDPLKEISFKEFTEGGKKIFNKIVNKIKDTFSPLLKSLKQAQKEEDGAVAELEKLTKEAENI
jgi:GTPase SAR1 family protein